MMRRFWMLAMAAIVAAATPAALAFADEAPATPETEDANRPGHVRLIGTGTLEAKGWGVAELRGDLNLYGTAFGGSLTVKDNAGDARVHVSGFGERHVNPDGSVTYVGVQGRVAITGSRVEITFRGANIDINVRGTGAAELTGYGWYSVNGGPRHPWKPF